MENLTATKTLGPVSARVINALIEHGKDIFVLNDACEIYGRGKQETTQFLRDLVNRRILARLKSGVFLILKTGQENTQLSNWPILVRMLTGTDKYYISHYSAMRLQGMTTHPLTTVTITLPKKRKPKKIQDFIYQFIYTKPNHFWGLSEYWVTRQEKVYVSDLERTILDGLDRPDLCGGIKEVIRGIWSKQKQIDWNKLADDAKRYHNKAAIKRLGFVLEILNLGGTCLPLLKNMIMMKKDYILLDPNGSKFGKHVSHWRVQLNMNVDELKASVWG